MASRHIGAMSAMTRRVVRFTALSLGMLLSTQLWAVTINVTDKAGAPVSGFRWVLEEDTTYHQTLESNIKPGDANADQVHSYNFYKSYMPVAGSGHSAGASADVPLPDASKRYYVTVMPDSAASDAGHAISGRQIPANFAGPVEVVVQNTPLPSAQIFVFAFHDNNPINDQHDGANDPADEPGLGGFTVRIDDTLDGVKQDVFGNMLGTVYDVDANGNAAIDPATGLPVIVCQGDGVIKTVAAADVPRGGQKGSARWCRNPYDLQAGEAKIKNLHPNKYGIQIVPPTGTTWQQTTTIEGTLGNDVWVKANEPGYFAENGAGVWHAFFGFVQPFNKISAGGVGDITGRVVNMRMSRPPEMIFSAGEPIANCWVGLNTSLANGGMGTGLYAAPCNADSTFTIPSVPPGRYEVVVWDRYLQNIFATHVVEVTNGSVALGDYPVFSWFSKNVHTVFNDDNGNGIRDPGEAGIPEQNINIRFRDGSINLSMPTDSAGVAPLEKIFPFFFWQVAEVDFARYKATGGTFTVDAGGPPATSGIGAGVFQPQIQDNGALSRTELSEPGVPVLLEGFQSFLGTYMTFDWGKQPYKVGENGGITGIVHYATTRAENDPRYAAADNWEPGIPRVQVCLYQDDGTGKIKDVDGDGVVDRCDIDNYPFQWSTGGAQGSEDFKRSSKGGSAFHAGDAINIVHTDSWDDNVPTGCPAGNMPNASSDVFYQNGKCYDGIRNFNQIRPALFDGGYGFFTYVPGGVASGAAEVPLVAGKYIVDSLPPNGYLTVKEQDKNVDYGESYTPTPLLVPPVCVGDTQTVPAELALFPGIPAPFAGLPRPLCDTKAITLADRQNAAVDFFMFTEVPITGHIQGFVLNDLANEFDINSPNFGEKQALPFIPVSIRDWTGREINRVYTDQYGSYNGLVPGNFTANRPSPTGYSMSMVQLCVNDPGPIMVAGKLVTDPQFSRQYTQFCYTLNFEQGRVTFADTPVLPVSAFAQLNQTPVDADLPNGSPILHSVNSPQGDGMNGPYLPTAANTLTIVSVGDVTVPNPAYTPNGTEPRMITRDHGFGGTAGSVTLGGVPLTITSWDSTTITAQRTPGTSYTTGQLQVKRGDNQLASIVGVTVTIPTGTDTSVVVKKQANESIQQAIDRAANASGSNNNFRNALVLIPPGNYEEMVIMYKNIRLQGWGAGSTVINATLTPTERTQQWRAKMSQLIRINAVTPLAGQVDPLVTPEAFLGSEGAPIFVIPRNVGASQGGFATNTNPNRRPRIDGLTLMGGAQAEGLVVNAYARGLEISNNRVINNQGIYGGGIRLGLPTTINPDFTNSQNTSVSIHDNQVCENGAVNSDGGGVVLHGGASNYRISNNWVCANFAAGNGAGIAHVGLSDNGLIEKNKILFNQSFNQTIGGGGSGGGILIAGPEPTAVLGANNVTTYTLGSGAGNVTINTNLIQGNNAGSGDGAGIAARFVNGAEMFQNNGSLRAKSNWYALNVFNNIIVNNVAGLAGGGIALQDSTNTNIIQNTVAHNDSTATAGNAFQTSFGCSATANQSCPQVAGIASYAHSPALLLSLGGGNSAAGRFSAPDLRNNIVWRNRSFYYQQTPSLPGVPGSQTIGHLVPDIGAGQAAVFADLGVVGVAGQLNPQNSVLTSTAGYNSNNTSNDPVFALPYFNGAPGLIMIQPEFHTALIPRAALDEGGNYIDVSYGPLSLVGNYHLAGPQSSAIDRGITAALSVSALLNLDYDGQVRPENCGTAPAPDAGADETLGSCSPLTANNDTATTTANTPVVINVTANDVAAGRPISVVTVQNPSAQGGSVGINATTSTSVTYTPALNFTGTDTFSYTATDGVSFRSATVTVTVTAAVAPAAPLAVSTLGTTPVTGNRPVANNNPVATPVVNGSSSAVSSLGSANVGGTASASATGSTYSAQTSTASASLATAGGSSATTTRETAANTETTGSTSEEKLQVAQAKPSEFAGEEPQYSVPVAKTDSFVLSQRNSRGDYLLTAPGVLANDTVVTGKKLKPVIVHNVKHGKVKLYADGSMTYTPPKDGMPKGEQTFSYRVSDGQSVSEVVTVKFSIEAPADKAGKTRKPAKPQASSDKPAAQSKTKTSAATPATPTNANIN